MDQQVAKPVVEKDLPISNEVFCKPIMGDSQNEGNDEDQHKIDLIVEEEIVPKPKPTNQSKKKALTPKPNKIEIAEKPV